MGNPLPTPEDERVAVLTLVNKWEKETEIPIGYWASEELIRAIATYAASQRQAERQRIREAVEGVDAHGVFYKRAVLRAIEGPVETGVK